MRPTIIYPAAHGAADMFTTTEKPAVRNRAAHVIARIVLSSGEVAGEGGGPTEAAAKAMAVQDAKGSENLRFQQAAAGHSRML